MIEEVDGPGERHRVFGVGLGRTGTLSLMEAMRALGLKAIHNLGLPDLQLIGAGRSPLLLAHIEAVANGTALPYRILDRGYPGSRFVLTIRNRDDWLESKRRFSELELEAWDTFDDASRRYKRFVREHVYGSMEFDADLWLAAFDRQLAEVLQYFADRSHDLLIMDITAGQGWEQLCPFLGSEMPSEPFPRVNAADTLRAWKDRAARVRDELSGRLQTGARVILVDQSELGLPSERFRPFLERDGGYWGVPADDDTAIRELGRMRDEGWRYLAVAWNAFWWLEHFREFARHLETQCECIYRSADLRIYDLPENSPRPKCPEPNRFC